MAEEDKKSVRDLYECGVNPEDIAELLDLDETEVMDYCADILMEEQI